MAFLELTSCREIGMSEGPISWLAMQRYCEVWGIEGEQREDFFYFVSRLDHAYLEWRAEKIKQQTTPRR